MKWKLPRRRPDLPVWPATREDHRGCRGSDGEEDQKDGLQCLQSRHEHHWISYDVRESFIKQSSVQCIAMLTQWNKTTNPGTTREIIRVYDYFWAFNNNWTLCQKLSYNSFYIWIISIQISTYIIHSHSYMYVLRIYFEWRFSCKSKVLFGKK